MKDENVHKGHRKRMRERIASDGIEGLKPHEILEYVLFHTVPYKDTNELSHRLIKTFGSISGVFDANYKDLMSVDGVSEVTAIFLSSFPKIMKAYNEDKSKCCNISSSEDIIGYLRPKYMAEINERFYVVCLDSGMNVRNCALVGEGTGNSVYFDNRNVTEIAIRNHATFVIISHNHPGGTAEPSREDIDATYQLKNILGAIGIKLIDHIIFADNEHLSMKESEKYRYIF